MVRIYALMWGRLVLYVGKTTMTLKQRETRHRSKSNEACSKYIPDDIDWEIKLLEEVEDDLATAREQYYFDTLKPFYNRCRPGQTQKEAQRKYEKTDAGKESRKECNRRYREKKKDQK